MLVQLNALVPHVGPVNETGACANPFVMQASDYMSCHLLLNEAILGGSEGQFHIDRLTGAYLQFAVRHFEWVARDGSGGVVQISMFEVHEPCASDDACVGHYYVSDV